MKAKNNFSVLLAETTAQGFITWSAAGSISGILSLLS